MTTDASANHPIVDLAIQGLQKCGDSGFTLDARWLQAISRALSAITAIPEAKRAVRELVQFAWLMESKKKSPKLARALVAAVREAVASLAARDARFADLQVELERSAARFAKFNGEKPQLRAPQVGRGRVAGTLCLAALVPVPLR